MTTTNDSLFETASREKYRFASKKGELTVEQLWELPLTSNNPGNDLDSIGMSIIEEITALSKGSLIKPAPTKNLTTLNNKVEIIKVIIAYKQAEAEAQRKRIERAAERRKLLDALESKQDESLKSLSAEEILKRLEELDGALPS